MHKSIILLAILFLGCSNAYGGDEFDTAWHNPDEYDSVSGNRAHVKSEFTTMDSAGRSGEKSVIQERVEISDSEGTRINVLDKETHRPDGSVVSHTEVRHTNKYGDQAVETTTRYYDKNGNLTGETYSLDKNTAEQPRRPDEGLQYEGVNNQESSDPSNAAVTVGGDKIRIEQKNNEKIVDLRAGQIYYIDHQKKEYRLANMDICQELAPLGRDYMKFALPLAETALRTFIVNPLVPASEKKTFEEALGKLQRLKDYEPPKPGDITYERTRKLGLFAGQIGEQVLAKDKKGNLVQEFWLSKTIVPRMTAPRKKTSKLVPDLQRLFGHLALKSVVHYPWGPGSSFQVKKVERIKINPADFLPPRGYSQGRRYDAAEIETQIRAVVPLEKN